MPAARSIRAKLLSLKKLYGIMEPSEVRELKLMREENAKLKGSSPT
jgi:hypothetical protein